MKLLKIISFVIAASFAATFAASAQNPLIRTMYSADPSARVFNNKVYVYPSHDILAQPGKGREGWFCMEDYHVYSSTNLTDWTDHGMIIHQNTTPWVRPNSYSMWAPDCIERNGKYYFYFPSSPNDTTINGRGFTIGVAVADKPEGPFVPQALPIKGVKGIDPNVFIDDNGQAYLYWSQGNIYGAKLKENMLELDGDVVTMQGLPTDKGLKEGPYLFKRAGKYYMTYPHVANKTERLEYAVGTSPLGPFEYAGVIMDETPNCWTNHHSIINYKNQWYLFYHANDYSPAFDKARSIRADSLHFAANGMIEKVNPTLRGIGIASATDKLQVDRYSDKHETVEINYIDTANRFIGWKAGFTKAGDWLRFNTVDFTKKKKATVTIRVLSGKGGELQLRSNSVNGTLIANINIPVSANWKEIKVPVQSYMPGINHLVLVNGRGSFEVDWVQFHYL